jgi:hypothetical protein
MHFSKVPRIRSEPVITAITAFTGRLSEGERLDCENEVEHASDAAPPR